MAIKLVQIIEKETDEIHLSMGPMDESKARKVAAGAKINLDHESFKVIIKDYE